MFARPRSVVFIVQTCPCDVDPLTLHFYIVKLGFTGVYFFHTFAPKLRMWVLIRSVPTINVLSKSKKNRIDVYETLCPQQMLVYACAEMSHLQNCSLKIYLKRALGGGVGLGGGSVWGGSGWM